MKYTKIILTVLISTALITTSCDIFTTSLGEAFANPDALSNASASAIVDSDDSTETEILSALSKKTTEEITSLSDEQKETVLKSTLGASIAMDKLGNLTDQLSDLMGDGDTDEESEPDGEESEDSMKDMISDAFSLIQDVDTKATATLLTDSATLKTADANTIASASLALIAQAAKSVQGDNKLTNDEDEVSVTLIDNLTNYKPQEGESDFDLETSTTADIVSIMMTGTTDGIDETDEEDVETKAELTAAITALQLLSTGKTTTADGSEVERSFTTTNENGETVDEEISVLGLDLTSMLSSLGMSSSSEGDETDSETESE